MDKRIAILLIIIAILLAGIGYMLFNQNTSDLNSTNPVNNTANNTTVVNATFESSSQDSESGEYGYCAICGKVLSYSEAHNEYTQGKVCGDCASNPYYQTGKGADYANQKLKQAYPEDYEGMFEDSANESYDDE